MVVSVLLPVPVQRRSPLERQRAHGARVDQPEVNRVEVVVLGRLRGELSLAPIHLAPKPDPFGLVRTADVAGQVGGEPEPFPAGLARDLPGPVVFGQVALVGGAVVEALVAHFARQAKRLLVFPPNVAAQSASRLEHRPAVLANVNARYDRFIRRSMLCAHVPFEVLLVFGGESALTATGQTHILQIVTIHLVLGEGSWHLRAFVLI